jgi:hypothetical protein
MATRVFSDEELAQLRSFPEITRDELIRFFTLPSADRAFVDPGRGRSARDRLGLAVRLCTLLWVDRSPDAYTDTAAVRAWSGVAAGAGDRQADSAGGPRAGINEGRLATGAPRAIGITASGNNTPVMLP